jgi:hypothetical protein
VNILLFSTIWIAMALFAAAEEGKRRTASASGWAWRAWTLGAAALVAHMLLAMGVRYDWSHDAAVRETARQTARVFGLGWGGGVYVNYCFAAVWIAEAWWWRARPREYFGRDPRIGRALRLFYFVIIVNAAVVFARPAGRIAGIVLVLALVWAWRPAARTPLATANS